MQLKQVNVEANDGQEKNGEESGCCKYGSWRNGCYFRAEECVDVELRLGVVRS